MLKFSNRHCLRGPAYSKRYVNPLGDLMYPGSYNPAMEVYNPLVRPNTGRSPVEVKVNLFLRAVEDMDCCKNVSELVNQPFVLSKIFSNLKRFVPDHEASDHIQAAVDGPSPAIQHIIYAWAEFSHNHSEVCNM